MRGLDRPTAPNRVIRPCGRQRPCDKGLDGLARHIVYCRDRSTGRRSHLNIVLSWIKASAPAIAFACVLASSVQPPRRAALTAYLPLNLEPEMERQIERVLILADEPILKRPFAVALVEDALPQACMVDKPLCTKVKRYLQRYSRDYAVTHASATGAITHDARGVVVPNEHGLPAKQPLGVVGAGICAAERLSAAQRRRDRLQGPYRADRFDAESRLQLGAARYRLPRPLAVARDRQQHADEHRSADDAFGDFVELRAAHQARIPVRVLSGPACQVGEPRADGRQYPLQRHGEQRQSASLRHAIVDRALSRLVARRQSAAGIRRRQRIAGFGAVFWLRDFFKPSGLSQTQGNQQASYVSRFLFPGKTPFAVYFQYAGEDNSDGGSYLLGNAALTAGIDIPRIGRHFDLTYEFSEWQNIWYVHNIFLDGMTNYGLVLGNWGADQRNFGDGVGARSQMLRVGWEPPFGGYLEERVRTLANQTYYGGDPRSIPRRTSRLSLSSLL